MGSAQKERDLVPIENVKGVPSSKFSQAGAGRSPLKPHPKDPHGIPGLSPSQGIWFGLWELGFSVLFAELPTWPPHGRTRTFLIDFSTLSSLGEQMLWVRPRAINFQEITLND